MNATNYTIRRLSGEKDKERLLNFWNENHEKNLDNKYKWIYDDNPAGKAVSLLAQDNDNPVGCVSIFPRQISIKGVTLRAGVCGDLLVHKKYRTVLPALKLVKQVMSVVQESEYDIIYGFPNRKAEPVMKRAGFKRLGPYVRIAKLIRPSKQLQKRDFNKYLHKLIAPLLDVALQLSAYETWYRFRRGFVCEEIHSFDERFDALWNKTKQRFPVTGERTSEFLTWKFRKKSDAEYRIYAIFNASRTEIKGYIIYCRDDESIAIKDFIFPEDKKAIRVLITHFLRQVRKISPMSVVVQFLENDGIISLFKKFGFLQRNSEWSTYYYCSEHVLKRFPGLVDSENWLISNFDWDT
jgi:GNAT acetyltransferase-like protein